ncbi:MAG: hypothetical protein AAGH15_15360 [Myxococcota bacterium]
MKIRRVVGTLVAAVLLSLAFTPSMAQADDGPQAPAPLKLNLSEDGDYWVRFITWHQLWIRQQQQNPGTTVNGDDRDWSWDAGIRRSRFLVLAQLDRLQMMFHAGINNQTFSNARKPGLFVHDLWTSYEVIEDIWVLGAGLHYFNGVSRLANASTLFFMTLDMPIFNWHVIETSDQFARQMGIFSTLRLCKFDLQMAVNRPFVVRGREPVPGDAQNVADYREDVNTPSFAGYATWSFFEQESNLLPYRRGTYLGKKKVLNVGGGWYWQNDAMVSLSDTDTRRFHDILGLGVDVFADIPLSNGSAITGYAGYNYFDFGPNNLRNIGIMNVGDAGSGTSMNGRGNAYPTIGTGHIVYAQGGYLLPGRPLGVQLQPYFGIQVSAFDALDEVSTVFDVGANFFMIGHNAKITINYRNRPIFMMNTDGDAVNDSRASEIITQLQLLI